MGSITFGPSEAPVSSRLVQKGAGPLGDLPAESWRFSAILVAVARQVTDAALPIARSRSCAQREGVVPPMQAADAEPELPGMRNWSGRFDRWLRRRSRAGRPAFLPPATSLAPNGRRILRIRAGSTESESTHGIPNAEDRFGPCGSDLPARPRARSTSCSRDRFGQSERRTFSASTTTSVMSESRRHVVRPPAANRSG
jgi:hypothetical protein